MNAKIVLSLIAVSILTNPSVCIAQPASLTPQAVKDFEWFSTLGFPDPKGCPLVRVDTGGSGQSGDEPSKEEYEDAFLLATNAAGFRVLTLDAFDRTYAQTNAKASGKISPPPVLHGGGLFVERIGFDVLEPSNEGTEVLGALQNPRKNDDLWWRFGRLLNDRTAVFVLAWGCWQNGCDSEAQQLYEQVQKMTAPGNNLGNEFAGKMYLRAFIGLGDADIPRPQILAEFQSFISNYADSEYVELAKKNADMLRRMISEDEVHEKFAQTNSAQLPVEQRVSELIFQLRNQTGFQSSNPGRCSVFYELHGSTNTPAHQLARLGYAAVPQLIAALDDPTPSHAMAGWVINTRSLDNFLIVGDCAEQVLEHIAGKNFLNNQLAASMSNTNQLAATRIAVESWWDVAKVQGEKENLILGIIHPTRDTPTQARMLCEHYPEVAVATLIQGAETTTDSWVRSWLMDDVSKFDDPRVVDFLYREMTNAPDLEDRVRAANDLPDREKAQAIRTMIKEWENLPKQALPEHGSLENFLAKCDSVEAIHTLGKDLRERVADMRYWVIHCVGDTNTWGNTNTFSTATLNAIEEILVPELDDTNQLARSFGLPSMRTIYDPRICDVAAFYLAERWSDRYVFNFSPSLSVRERQRVECLNVWRRAHNQPVLPSPPPPAHRVSPDQATVVTSINWADDSAKPSTNFVAGVNEFQGKPLDAKKLVAFLDSYGANPEQLAAGVELTITKDEDMTGVTMKIRLLRGYVPWNLQLWDFEKYIIIDGKTIYHTGGGSSVGQYFDAGSSGNFAEYVEKALAAGPETSFEIRFHLTDRNPD